MLPFDQDQSDFNELKARNGRQAHPCFPILARLSRCRKAGLTPKLAGAAVLAAVLATAPVRGAGPEIINGQAFYPEGPLWQDGRLFYAEMTRDRVMVWNGESTEVFWQRDDCGPTAIAAVGEGYYLVLCHLGHKLVRVSAAGGTVDSIEFEEDGRDIRYPNDATTDGKGGIYISSSGPFDKNASWSGAILFVGPTGRPRRVAEGIRYANGVAVSPDGRHLFVSEHLLRRVLRFRIGANGGLSDRQVFFDLDEAAPPVPRADDLGGPDGLEFDRNGLLWIAEYGAGRVLAVDSAGRLRQAIPLPDKYTTNLTFAPDGRTLYVTASSSNRVEPYIGRVYRIVNPLQGNADGG